ncbi:MAG TPA: alpha/beta fold hydrolase [Nocardioidaceae bacterium]|nr:alpha/beta fold hydrolase [Nocardioidaceae bacterium]
MGSPLGAFLCPPGYAGPSGLRALGREATAVLETVRLVRRSARDSVRRAGRPAEPVSGSDAGPGPAGSLHQGGPVVLVPGFLAGDTSLFAMSRFLRRQGHRTYRSAMHVNVGCTQAASEALERRVEAVAARRESRVSLVGHSLGGLLARGVAARRPDLVDGLVTLGSPLLAPGAVHPVLAFDLAVVVAMRRVGLGALMGEDCTSGDCARLSWEQSQQPLSGDVAFTSVFSRRDGVVDWRSCLDPVARTVEVRTSHLGMAVDPAVLDVVAAALARRRRAESSAEPEGSDGSGVVALSRPARWPEAPIASAG